MIALWIILGILLFLFLILLIKIEVLMQYSQEITLVLKILFFKIVLLSPDKPKEEKKEKKPEKEKPKEEKPKEKKPEEKKKKQSYLSKLKEKKGLSGLVSLFVSVAKIAVGALKGIFSHIVLKKFDVGIALSGEDAASTAVTYGKLCSVIYPAINVITSVMVCKDYHVTIEPVFDIDKDTEVFADIYAYLRPIFALHEALKAGVKILIARIKL